MQTLLNDIELDIQELTCLVQAISRGGNPALRAVALRNIRQMQERLSALQQALEKQEPVPHEPVAPQNAIPEPVVSEPVVVPPTPILAERIKSAGGLRRAISLNDSFRFTRELFHGDASLMNETVRRLDEAASLDEALQLFASVVEADEENAAAADFVELLKKHFQ